MTLVELLVVIGIIAALVGLLLPAINAAVESSRRSSCLNNQKQLASAAAQFAAANRQLPGWRNEIKLPGGGGAYPSWPVMILPQLDQAPVFNQWISGSFFTSGLTSAAPVLPVFICPSTKMTGAYRKTASTYYVGNAGSGIASLNTSTGLVQKGDGAMVDAAPRVLKPTPWTQFYGADDRFWCQLANEPAGAGAVIQQSMTPDFINANDGLTNTLLFSERSGEYRNASGTINVKPVSWDGRLQNNPAIAARPYVFGVGLFYLPGGGSERYINLPYAAGAATPHLPVPAFGMSGSVTAGSPIVNSPTGFATFPSSKHPGGAVAAFCDGRTLFLADSLAPHVYAQLLSSSPSNSSIITNTLNTAPADRRPYVLDERDYQ
jgi:type II secretory pathway pseudopilin PulG